MKRWKIAFRVMLALACLGCGATYFWLKWPVAPTTPVGPQEYSAFAVDLDGEWITIRNTGSEILTDCDIEFTARMDSPGGVTYQGKRNYRRWEPGEAQKIGIAMPTGPMDVASVRFAGTANSPDKGWRFWQLTFPASSDGG
jgi:hypothetical protein